MFKRLHQLSAVDLEHLASALRASRLRSPFSALALGRYVTDGEVARQLADELTATAEGGVSNELLADLVSAIADDRRQNRDPDRTQVDLVWTGPEMAGVPNRDTPVVVRELFASARHEVLVAGFAVYQGRTIFKPLAERMDEFPDLEVTFFLDVQRPHGDTSASSEILQRFAHRFKTNEWPGDRLPTVYYDPRSLELDTMKKACLHAKCIVVDGETAFVSSANFTEAAQERNIEVGVLVQGGSVPKTLADHFQSLRNQRVVKLVIGE